MKAKVFIAKVTKPQDSNKPRDYWGMLFVGVIFVALMSSFFIDCHIDKQNTLVKVATTAHTSLVIKHNALGNS